MLWPSIHGRPVSVLEAVKPAEETSSPTVLSWASVGADAQAGVGTGDRVVQARQALAVRDVPSMKVGRKLGRQGGQETQQMGSSKPQQLQKPAAVWPVCPN